MTVPLPDYTGLTKLALDASGMTPQELAEAAVACQDTIAALRTLERIFVDSLGKDAGKHTGNVGDGRQYEVTRSADRREWDHTDWQRDVRRKIVEGLPPSVVLVDVTTGEDFHRSLEFVVSEALIAAQQVHGAGAPRSRDLKSLGLYASDYCTTSPAGWRLTAVRPEPDAGAAPTPTAPAAIPTQREAS